MLISDWSSDVCSSDLVGLTSRSQLVDAACRSMLLLACPRLQPVPDTIHPHRVLGGEVRAQSRAGRTAQASRVHTWLGHADDLGVRDPRHRRLDEAIDRLPWTSSLELNSIRDGDMLERSGLDAPTAVRQGEHLWRGTGYHMG